MIIGKYIVEDFEGVEKEREIFFDEDTYKTYIFENGVREEVYRNYLIKDRFVLKGEFPDDKAVKISSDFDISDFKRYYVSLRDVPYMWIVDIMVNEKTGTEVWVRTSMSGMSHLVTKFSNCIPMDNVLRWMHENIGDFIRREYDGSHLD